MKNHEFSDIFPMMVGKEYNELKQDIRENGLMQPITTFEGQVLDGRNRFKACEELGIKPQFEQFEGNDALQYVMSTNLKRRHLTDSQKAVVGRRYKVYYAKIYQNRKNQPFGEHSSIGNRGVVELVPPEKARDKAGEVIGVSGRYIDMADEVIKKKPEMEEKIISGEIKLKTAYRELKLEEQKKEVIKLEQENQIKGKYDVIVVDPPWDYGTKYDPEGHRGTAPYPTMSMEDIKKIELPTSESCVLWLWTTNTFLLEMKELIREWGFEAKTILTWDKQMIGVGYYLRNITEHCILCFKGKPYFNNKKWSTLISEKRTTHSTKPEIFYKMVDEICAGRKLDYFARKKRDGWDVYGDEVTNE